MVFNGRTRWAWIRLHVKFKSCYSWRLGYQLVIVKIETVKRAVKRRTLQNYIKCKYYISSTWKLPQHFLVLNTSKELYYWLVLIIEWIHFHNKLYEILCYEFRKLWSFQPKKVLITRFLLWNCSRKFGIKSKNLVFISIQFRKI